MSKYVWVAAAALVVLSAAILFWVDRSGDEAAPSLPPGPHRRWLPADGGEMRPHWDRAGLRRNLTK